MAVRSGALAQHGGNLGKKDVNARSWGVHAILSITEMTVCTTDAYKGPLRGKKFQKEMMQ